MTCDAGCAKGAGHEGAGGPGTGFDSDLLTAEELALLGRFQGANVKGFVEGSSLVFPVDLVPVMTTICKLRRENARLKAGRV